MVQEAFLGCLFGFAADWFQGARVEVWSTSASAVWTQGFIVSRSRALEGSGDLVSRVICRATIYIYF